MSRIRIDDLPVVENLTPEEEELILGAGRKTFRPTLESLENREMMDAGIGAAVMQQLPSFGERAQIRLLAQETSALPNQSNPLSQSLTERGQGFLVQTPQLNERLHAAADRIFSAWSHNVDRVVQNVQALQHTANQMLASALRGLPQGPEDTRSEGQTLADNTAWSFDHYVIKGGYLANKWGFKEITGCDYDLKGDGKYQVRLQVKFGLQNKTTTVCIDLQNNGGSHGAYKYYSVTSTSLGDNYDGWGSKADLDSTVKLEFNNYHQYDIAGRANYNEGQAANQLAGQVFDSLQLHLIAPGYRLSNMRDVSYSQIEGGIHVEMTVTEYRPDAGVKNADFRICMDFRNNWQDAQHPFVLTNIGINSSSYADAQSCFGLDSALSAKTLQLCGQLE